MKRKTKVRAGMVGIFLLCGAAALAQPSGGGTPPRETCTAVMVPILVDDGHDARGFPINPRVELRSVVVCKAAMK